MHMNSLKQNSPHRGHRQLEFSQGSCFNKKIEHSWGPCYVKYSSKGAAKLGPLNA